MILFQPRPSEYEEALEYARAEGYGFEVTDFMFYPVLDDADTCARLVKRLDGAPVRTLHGPFADLNFSGGDPDICAVTERRIVRCCECAAELGVHKMVLHSCFFPLMPPDDVLYPLWDENAAELLTTLADRFDMTFCIENLLDITPAIIEGMMKAANGHPHIRACLDAGHANLSRTGQAEWNRELSPWLTHFHLSDNGGMYDDHIALGDGCVDWASFFASLDPRGADPATPGCSLDFVLEVTGLARVRRSVDWLRAAGYMERLAAFEKV